MTAAIQSAHDSLREGPTVAVEVLEGDFGIVSAVVEIERGDVTNPRLETRRQSEFREIGAPEWRGDQEKSNEGGSRHSLDRYFSNTEAPKE